MRGNFLSCVNLRHAGFLEVEGIFASRPAQQAAVEVEGAAESMGTEHLEQPGIMDAPVVPARSDRPGFSTRPAEMDLRRGPVPAPRGGIRFFHAALVTTREVLPQGQGGGFGNGMQNARFRIVELQDANKNWSLPAQSPPACNHNPHI